MAGAADGRAQATARPETVTLERAYRACMVTNRMLQNLKEEAKNP
jgi:hypothetical protein